MKINENQSVPKNYYMNNKLTSFKYKTFGCSSSSPSSGIKYLTKIMKIVESVCPFLLITTSSQRLFQNGWTCPTKSDSVTIIRNWIQTFYHKYGSDSFEYFIEYVVLPVYHHNLKIESSISGGGSSSELPTSIKDFDSYCSSYLDPFVTSCSALGGDADAVGKLTKEVLAMM